MATPNNSPCPKYIEFTGKETDGTCAQLVLVYHGGHKKIFHDFIGSQPILLWYPARIEINDPVKSGPEINCVQRKQN